MDYILTLLFIKLNVCTLGCRWFQSMDVDALQLDSFANLDCKSIPVFSKYVSNQHYLLCDCNLREATEDISFDFP